MKNPPSLFEYQDGIFFKVRKCLLFFTKRLLPPSPPRLAGLNGLKAFFYFVLLTNPPFL